MPVSRFYSSTAGKMTLQLGVTAVATALSVDTTVGLPGSTPFTLLLDAGTSAEEIVTVTQVSGNTLVVQRGQDGTSAQAHANGAIIRHALTARDLRDSREHEAAPAAHGTTSAVVGVNDVQALTNKNLTAASNTFPSSLATAAALNAEVIAGAAHSGATAAHGATGAVVGTTNVQTLTNKTLGATQFTGDLTGSAHVAVGDATSSTQYVYRVFKHAQTGTNTYEARYYLDNSGDLSKLTHVLMQNGVEVARSSLAPDGSFQVNNNFVAPTGDVTVGSQANAAQQTLRINRKATTGSNAYEGALYLGDPGDGSLALVGRLVANGSEQSRFTMFGDSRGIVFDGKVTAPNISDTGWVSTGFGTGAGWNANASQYRTVNGVTTLHYRFSRSGGNMVIGASGSVADDNAISIPTAIRSGFTVSVTGVVNAASGSFGWYGKIVAGVLYVQGSANPNVTWNTGADFFGTVTYIV